MKAVPLFCCQTISLKKILNLMKKGNQEVTTNDHVYGFDKLKILRLDRRFTTRKLDPLKKPDGQLHARQHSQSSSSIRCFGFSTSSNCPFFTAQMNMSQHPAPRQRERTIRIIRLSSMVFKPHQAERVKRNQQ